MQNQIDQDVSKYPSIYWERFFSKFSEIDLLPVSEWKSLHLIAYFCKLYKNQFNTDYSFKFNSNSPSKSFETFQINKLGGILSTDPSIIKSYIDWWFATQIIAKNKKFRSISAMTDANIVNIYKFDILIPGNLSIDRTTQLPNNYLQIISGHDDSIKTYGDLSFIDIMIKSNTADQKYIKMFNELKQSNIDLSMLAKIK